jgi:hypothetical protein
MSINLFSNGGLDLHCTGSQITYTLFEGVCLQFDPTAAGATTVNIATIPSCSPFSIVLFFGNSCNHTLNEWPPDMNTYCTYTWETGSESPIGVCKACNSTRSPGPDNWLSFKSIGFICSGNQDSFQSTLSLASITSSMTYPKLASSPSTQSMSPIL